MLAQETGGAAWFCWSDGMVDPYGLVTAAGEPKDEYVAFQEAHVSGTPPEANDAIRQTMAEFEQAGGTVGTIYAVDNTDVTQTASTDAGLFISRAGVPGAQILLDARAHHPFP